MVQGLLCLLRLEDFHPVPGPGFLPQYHRSFWGQLMGRLYGSLYPVDVCFLYPFCCDHIIWFWLVCLAERFVQATLGVLGLHVACHLQDTVYAALEKVVQFHCRVVGLSRLLGIAACRGCVATSLSMSTDILWVDGWEWGSFEESDVLLEKENWVVIVFWFLAHHRGGVVLCGGCGGAASMVNPVCLGCQGCIWLSC